VLNFLTGSYYVKLSTYQTEDNAHKALQTIGTFLVKHLKQNNAMPRLFQAFPVSGKLSNTEQYVARNFLGYSFLNSTYVISYKNGTSFKVFVIKSAAPEKANSMLAEYLKAVPNGAVTQLAPDTYQILDPNNGVIKVQIFNQYFCGIINCPDGKMGDEYLKKVITYLSRNLN
jgi:hypothetical protein